MTSESANGHRGEAAVQLVPQEVAELAAEISEAQTTSGRRRLARRVPELAGRSRLRMRSGREVSVRGLKSGGQSAWTGLQAGSQFAWKRFHALGTRLTSEILEMAPKIPIRNLSTLREQYPGRATEELADLLIEGASHASAGVGAAVGAAAAVPFIPTVPVELGVETLALVAVELKLIAELHEVYGMPAPGGKGQRMIAYTASWANRRGVVITSGGLALAIGSPLRRKLERRVMTKAGQSALSLAPLLAGAAAGALINHRETRRLGNQVRADLRERIAESPALAG